MTEWQQGILLGIIALLVFVAIHWRKRKNGDKG